MPHTQKSSTRRVRPAANVQTLKTRPRRRKGAGGHLGYGVGGQLKQGLPQGRHPRLPLQLAQPPGSRHAAVAHHRAAGPPTDRDLRGCAAPCCLRRRFLGKRRRYGPDCRDLCTAELMKQRCGGQAGMKGPAGRPETFSLCSHLSCRSSIGVIARSSSRAVHEARHMRSGQSLEARSPEEAEVHQHSGGVAFRQHPQVPLDHRLHPHPLRPGASAGSAQGLLAFP